MDLSQQTPTKGVAQATLDVGTCKAKLFVLPSNRWKKKTPSITKKPED
jgi:hypothetical protein